MDFSTSNQNIKKLYFLLDDVTILLKGLVLTYLRKPNTSKNIACKITMFLNRTVKNLVFPGCALC